MALAVASLLVLGSWSAFLLSQRETHHADAPDRSMRVPRLRARVHREEKRITPEPPFEIAAQVPTAAAHSARPEFIPISSTALAAFTARYKEVQEDRRVSRESLAQQLNADPELTEVSRAKLQQLRSPLFFIALAQALDDGLLRPALLEDWGRRGLLHDAFVQRVESAAVRFGYADYARPRTADQLAALVKRLEPHFQTDYDRLVHKLDVREELLHPFETEASGEVLDYYYVSYLTRRGYSYDRRKQAFLPEGGD
jgi:hypothetical protein